MESSCVNWRALRFNSRRMSMSGATGFPPGPIRPPRPPTLPCCACIATGIIIANAMTAARENLVNMFLLPPRCLQFWHGVAGPIPAPSPSPAPRLPFALSDGPGLGALTPALRLFGLRVRSGRHGRARKTRRLVDRESDVRLRHGAHADVQH